MTGDLEARDAADRRALAQVGLTSAAAKQLTAVLSAIDERVALRRLRTSDADLLKEAAYAQAGVIRAECRPRQKRERKSHTTYFWAGSRWRGRERLVDSVPMTAEEAQGLEWARVLADYAATPGWLAPRDYWDGRFETRADVDAYSRELGVHPSIMRMRIGQARRRLFGALSDSGIRARARASTRSAKEQTLRTCEWCGELLQPATRRRRFCPPPRSCKVYAWRDEQRRAANPNV
jgi:hypothetical protein